MEARSIEDMLFKVQENIKLLGKNEKMTGKAGPAGIGRSKSRPASMKGNAKFNAAARVLDMLIIDKSINALEFDATREAMIYTEFTMDGKKFHASFDEKCEASFAGTENPSNLGALVPVVMYALSSASNAEETKSYFQTIVKEYNTQGAADIASVLGFCDSFYYEFILKTGVSASHIYLDDLSLSTMTQAYESNYADEMAIFDGISGLPMLEALEGVELRSKSKKSSTKAISSDLESCLNGDHIIPYEWSIEQQVKIPLRDTLNDFIPSDAFYSVLKKIEQRTARVLSRWDVLQGDETKTEDQKRIEAIGRDYINLFIVGKPGTGKTTAGYALGAATGMPVYTVAATKNTEEDTFQGMTKVVNGNFQFVSTDFLDAYTNGGIIILEEINLPDPAVIMGALGQAVEAPFILQKDGYQTIRRHPMCVIIATMNIGTNGAKGVNQAFSSRFKQTYILDDPKEADFIAILEKQGHDHKKAQWVYDAYQHINSYLKSPEVNAEDVCLNVTLRGCIGALENMAEGDSPKEAIYNTLVGKIAEVDLELAESVKKDVVNGLPNLR